MARKQDILNARILSLSESDYADLKRLGQGTLIVGSVGGGKSSTSGKQIAKALPRMLPDCGGLCLTTKANERESWITYAKACGRQNNLIVVNPAPGSHSRRRARDKR